MIENKIDKKKHLDELVYNQLKHILSNRRLLYNDLVRISKHISTSIFDENKCCIWNGYVTNAKISHGGIYVNFFFRKKKVALHRLLYENFVEPLDDDCYLKFTCKNKKNRGKCCNINHMTKHKYNIIEDQYDNKPIKTSTDTLDLLTLKF